MFKTLVGLTVFVLVATAQGAVADDWTGQAPAPAVQGPVTTAQFNGNMLTYVAPLVCSPSGTPPPCTGGSHLVYDIANSGTIISGVPAAAAASDSNVNIFAGGFYADPASPTGVSFFSGPMPLSAFARSTTVDALSGTVSGLTTTVGGLNIAVGSLQGSVSALNASMDTMSTQLSSLSIRFDQFQQQVHLEQRDLRQGVAMSLAMDGVGDLGPDERVAISMNVGTYGGQNGIAAGVAFRAAQHLTFNAGIGTGVNGGLVGGRAGVRMAW